MSFAAAEIERLLSNMIRIGVVSALDEGAALVTVDIGELTTDWLPWITARAGATRTWSAPRVGEQVVVLAPYGDTAQGIVLPSIYQDNHPAPAASKDIEHVVFPDGSTVEYNSASNTLTVTVAGNGNVIVNCKQATVNADDSVTLNTPQTTCKGALTVEGLLTFLSGMHGYGGEGGGATMAIDGDVAFQNGTLTHNSKDVGSTHQHREQGDGELVSPPV